MNRGPAELHVVTAFQTVAEQADHIDTKRFRSEKTLEQFVVSLLLERPKWMLALFRLRGVLAKLLRLDHPDDKTPETSEVIMEPGKQVGIFTVQECRESRYWIGAIRDEHLDAWLAVSTSKRGEFNEHAVTTVVAYRDCRGPIYFNLIRPFHHLVVYAMGKAAAKSSGRNRR